MAPTMEGTHTVLRLHNPIRELSRVSLYVPTARGRRFTYEGRALSGAQPTNCHDRRGEERAGEKQKGQSCKNAIASQNSKEATKGAIAELHRLAAEHHQLLADLFALCADCTARVRMGNQDGKPLELKEGEMSPPVEALSGSNLQHSLTVSPEHKMAASQTRKLKKLGMKKADSAEEFLQNKMKKKVKAAKMDSAQPGETKPGVQSHEDSKSLGTPCSTLGFDVSGMGSYDSNLTMEENFDVTQEGWEFMADSRNFEPDMDLCSELSEYDNELYLGYGVTSSFLEEVQDQIRQEQMLSGSNLRPFFNQDKSEETKQPPATSAHQLYDQISRRDAGVRVVAKVQEAEGVVQWVSHTSPHVSANSQLSSSVPQEGTVTRRTQLQAALPAEDQVAQGEVLNKHLYRGPSGDLEEGEEWRGLGGSAFFGDGGGAVEPPGSLRLTLQRPADSAPGRKSGALKSPSSPSLSGVFNTSYPVTNSLQSMSPVLSPLSSKLPSPQLNHRIVLLSEKDGGLDRDDRKWPQGAASYLDSGDEPKVTTEIIDKNGNKRTITRLDLNLSRQGGGSKWTAPSTTVTVPSTAETDIWLLDADDAISQSHEAPSRVPRPDHLDFLRITPPEDDIIGDTPCYPTLELTDRSVVPVLWKLFAEPVETRHLNCHRSPLSGREGVAGEGGGKREIIRRHAHSVMKHPQHRRDHYANSAPLGDVSDTWKTNFLATEA
ncbi:hypothetical protein SKAU_G00337500 [Synaphobranchus kaupii]|uniref:Uncharacterized protein n=1 Tax=Synaphobranchus kaupii TaxID=118154 RepID=A0A9Q1IJ72_SYNKA|nr:hypothetical protein SKAU_G00337500 [Synaphobranchus kaupii]